MLVRRNLTWLFVVTLAAESFLADFPQWATTVKAITRTFHG